MFESSSGLKVNILIGLNNTFKDAATIFCKKINIIPSLIGEKIHLMFNGCVLKMKDKKTLEQIGIIGNSKILIIDTSGILGA